MLLFSLSIVSAQTIPSSRTVNWADAGIQTTQTSPSVSFNFINNGGIPDGMTTNDTVLTNIMSSLNPGDSAIIYFPNGDYLFNQTMNLTSNIFLIGESSDSTILKFDLGGAGNLISINGNQSLDTATITQNIYKGDLSINYNGSNLFNPGDFIRLIDNDSSNITSIWAIGTSGQIAKIDSINGPTIYVHNEIRRSYALSNNPIIVRLNMIENNKIESLSILRLDSTAGQTSNINFAYAHNSTVNCVKSNFCNFSHVDVQYSSNIEISGSYFQDSYGYGSGGRGYGIMLQFTSGECLVSNNKFNHLRHSIILQAGANGNVLAYNFSINPFWTGLSLPSDAAGDLVLHGNYTYANLFEGNTTQNIVIDNSHGINGPNNTFFRNRAESYGIVMNSPQATDSVNFVGNEIPNSALFKGNYLLAGVGHFQHGNNVRGILTPAGTGTLADSSYFLSSPPSYYLSNSSWPPIGTPNANNAHMIEAEEEYNTGNLTQCAIPITTSTKNPSPIEENKINVYPNPFSSIINISAISSPSRINRVAIYSSLGKLIYQSKQNKSSINLGSKPNGLYIIQLTYTDGNSLSKKLIKR